MIDLMAMQCFIPLSNPLPTVTRVIMESKYFRIAAKHVGHQFFIAL